jgi:hypothetical protein
MHADGLPTATDSGVLDAYGRFGRDFETWLTWLEGEHPWLDEASSLRQRAAFLDVSKSLARVILRAQNAALADAAGGAPDWLRGLVEAWANRDAAVITVNYDALIEKTFTAIVPASATVLYTFPLDSLEGAGRLGGRPTFRFQLLKLHGSVTWYVFSSGGGAAGGPVYDADLNSGWATVDDEMILSARVGSRRPLIVPPIIGKEPFLDRPELRDQWVRAGYRIQEADRIFLVGYSQPRADLAMRFLLDRMPSGCEIFAVNRDKGVANRLQKAFASHVVDRRYCARPDAVRAMAIAYASIPAAL